MRNMIKREPVVVGGVGGSGTRVVAEMLKSLDFYIGSDLNESLDNLWFTLLFKRPRWFYGRRDLQREVPRGLSVFEKVMKQSGKIGWNDLAFIASSGVEMAVHGHDRQGSGRGLWSAMRIKTMLECIDRPDPATYAGWGWKEPNSHIFIEYLNDFFPDLRYVHVIRHGLDMAFSPNQTQLYNWGKTMGVTVPDRPEAVPPASLEYWIESNRRAIRFGETVLRDRFLLVNFDRLQAEPESGVREFLDFVGGDIADADRIDGLCQAIHRPETSGRYRKNDLSRFPRESLDEVRELGFEVLDPTEGAEEG